MLIRILPTKLTLNFVIEFDLLLYGLTSSVSTLKYFNDIENNLMNANNPTKESK